MIDAVGKYVSYPFYWELINTYIQKYNEYFESPLTYNAFDVNGIIDVNITKQISDFHKLLQPILIDIINKKYIRLGIDSKIDYGNISTPEVNIKTFNREYLDSLANDNLVNVVFET